MSKLERARKDDNTDIRVILKETFIINIFDKNSTNE